MSTIKLCHHQIFAMKLAHQPKLNRNVRFALFKIEDPPLLLSLWTSFSVLYVLPQLICKTMVLHILRHCTWTVCFMKHTLWLSGSCWSFQFMALTSNSYWRSKISFIVQNCTKVFNTHFPFLFRVIFLSGKIVDDLWRTSFVRYMQCLLYTSYYSLIASVLGKCSIWIANGTGKLLTGDLPAIPFHIIFFKVPLLHQLTSYNSMSLAKLLHSWWG